MAMKFQKRASRITDVVPANFLCDSQIMEKIAQSQLKDETALHQLDVNMSVLESRRECLQDKLTAVERLISETVAEQTRLRSSIETHKSLLARSPVRSLPEEVLSEIFLSYIALSQTPRENIYKEIVACHRIHEPILLVCRRWRNTALADPRLWTTLPLIASGGEGKDKSYEHPLLSESPEERAAYWNALRSRIQQTSALPLHLLFHIAKDGYLTCEDYGMGGLWTFIRLFSRAHSISLHIQFLDYRFPELSYMMNNANIPLAAGVHTARVIVDDNVFERKILSAIPHVEVLETSLSAVDWLIETPMAGHCLRSLHILAEWESVIPWESAIPLAHVLDILDRAPLLETLKVPRISITSSVRTLRVVTHMRLSTFHLCATAGENDAVFGHLTLPALRSLSYLGVPPLWPRRSNMAFLERSGCMLQSLAFRRCRVKETRLIAMLTAQKALSTLQLNFFANEGAGSKDPIPMAILEFLSSESKDGSDRPLPALTFLAVLVHRQQLEAVKRLVQSRSSEQAKKCRIAALREVHIHVQRKQRNDDTDDDTDDDSDDEEIEKDEHAALFKDFVSNGVDIRISYQ